MRKSRTVVGTAPLRTDTKTTTQLRGFFYVSLPGSLIQAVVTARAVKHVAAATP